MPENDITELQTLDIYQLTEEQYNDLASSSELDPNAIYMTPASNAVMSVNGQTPSANGNVDVDAVYSVNNVSPDSSGNVDIVALPSGGTTGQVLAKQSASDGDADWEDLPTVDQSYDSTSTNAQSGVAVGSAIATKQNTVLYGTTAPTSADGSDGDVYILYS